MKKQYSGTREQISGCQGLGTVGWQWGRGGRCGYKGNRKDPAVSDGPVSSLWWTREARWVFGLYRTSHTQVDHIHVAFPAVILYCASAKRYHWGKLGEGYRDLYCFLQLQQ